MHFTILGTSLFFFTQKIICSEFLFSHFQEFHLSQTYHEGLLKLQDKDYIKARELLESVLKDPIISSAQVIKIKVSFLVSLMM